LSECSGRRHSDHRRLRQHLRSAAAPKRARLTKCAAACCNLLAMLLRIEPLIAVARLLVLDRRRTKDHLRTRHLAALCRKRAAGQKGMLALQAGQMVRQGG